MNVYDFDGTIYAGDCTLDFWKFCAKNNPKVLVALPGALIACLQFKLGVKSREQFKERFYHFLRYGASPKKIYLLANETFKDSFSKEEIKKWLKLFIKRFFTQQFKRNCLPDSIKVGSISLSPRGDLRMPSDASYLLWMNELDNLDK